MPHMRLSVGTRPRATPSRPRSRADAAHGAGQDAPRGRGADTQIQVDRAVRDVLQVVGELLGPGGLAGHPQLGEAGQARLDDQPLPVLRDLAAQLLEERGPDRARADDAHVSAHDVPQLRQLVEVGKAQEPAEARDLRLRALRELVTEVGAQPRLRVRGERAELQHREDAPRAAHPPAAVEHRRARRQADRERDRPQDRGQHDQRGAGDAEVEGAQRGVDAAVLVTLMGHLLVALGEGAPRRRADRVGLRRRAFQRPGGRNFLDCSESAHRTAPSIMSTSSAGSRRCCSPAEFFFCSSSPRGSVSGRKRCSLIKASSTPPSLPP